MRLLFVTLTNDIGADRIVSELGMLGAACAVLGPRGNYPSLSRFVGRRFQIRVFGNLCSSRILRRRLGEAAKAWDPERIVPLDELSALLLRTLATDRSCPEHLKALLIRSFGDPSGYAAACHRLPLMQVASEVGVRTPAFGAAREAGAIGYPLLVKRDHSSGSGGVVVVARDADLQRAIGRARVKQKLKRSLAWATGFDHGRDAILLQRYIPGRLAMRTVVADQGTVVDGFDMVAAQSHPEKRASTVLEPIDCPDMGEAANRIVAELGCSGFLSFDFIIDESNRAFLIEMNPRPIGSTHLGRSFGHDLGHAFLAGRKNVAPASTAGTGKPASVALFPKELERDPSGSFIEARAGLHHDVPWHEPDLVAAHLSYLQAAHPRFSTELASRLRRGQPGDAVASEMSEDRCLFQAFS